MKDVIDFLKELGLNNNRPWFLEHKDQYLHVQAQFNSFGEELLKRTCEFDESVRDLQLSDCTYRLYRDLRFTPDKRPYKTHMGIFICPGGKKSGFGGYYFQIGVGTEEQNFDYRHVIAVGDYRCSTKVMQILREDIESDGGEFNRIITKQINPRLSLDPEYRLKRMPRGFKADGQWADYMKYNNFCLTAYLEDDFVLQSDLAERIAGIFQSAMPFLRYINRAIAYVGEEKL